MAGAAARLLELGLDKRLTRQRLDEDRFRHRDATTLRSCDLWQRYPDWGKIILWWFGRVGPSR